MITRTLVFTSLAAFLAAKASLPYPSVCKITDASDTFVFFRHSSSSTPDTMTTLGASRFHTDYSVLNGPALLS